MKNTFDYVELDSVGNPYRVEYYNSIQKLILKKQAEADKVRDDFAKNIINEPEKYREMFKNMLGWPLNKEATPYLSVKETFVTSEEDCDIYRVQIEVFEDFWFYGMLFKKRSDSPLPLVIAQHGGLGAPEMVAGFFNNGNYNKVIKRLLNKGVHVFAPQLLLWEETRLGPKTERQWVDTTLKQLGGSVTALEIYCIERCIDWLETKEFVNNSFGMIGLSYGGFYTMFTTAVDTRIKAAVSSSQFNNRYRYNWFDWVFQNAANTFFDSEAAALIYPRPFYIEVGDNDPLFDVLFAKQEIKRLEKYYANAADNLKFHVFKGVHEFSADIEMGIDFMLSHL